MVRWIVDSYVAFVKQPYRESCVSNMPTIPKHGPAIGELCEATEYMGADD